MLALLQAVECHGSQHFSLEMSVGVFLLFLFAIRLSMDSAEEKGEEERGGRRGRGGEKEERWSFCSEEKARQRGAVSGLCD